MSDSAKQSDNEGAAMHRADTQQARVNKRERTRSDGSSLQGVVVHKVCCVCGEVLNHKPRFKDSQGRYWCPACNERDHQKYRPAPCSDCGIEMPRTDLKEVGSLLLCPVCVQKCTTESKAVTDVRLRALAHSAESTERKVNYSRQYSGVNWPMMVAVGLAALLVILLIVILAT